MEYLFFVFVCKLVIELIFKLDKIAYKYIKAKKKPSVGALDQK